MQLLNRQFDLDQFFDKVTSSDQSVLMLDYDGTLAPFRPERDQAIPYAGVRERLVKLIRLRSTRLVLVSGRWSEDLIPLLGLHELPEIWGCHGAERVLPDGTIRFVELKPEAQQGLEKARTWAMEKGLQDCLEHKPTSVAFHWRGFDPDRVVMIRITVGQQWAAAAAESGLQLTEFDGGLELRLAGIDKGRAVRDILSGTAAGLPAAYLGDDLSDEDAFAAVPPGGLKVLVRTEFRDTKADLWLKPPGELLDFLDRWLACLTLI